MNDRDDDSPFDPAAGGVVAAAITPLARNGAIDGSRFAKYCRWLLDNGCDAVSVFGTTGEGNSFSVNEKISSLNGLAEAGLGRKLIPGVGCCAIEDTVSLTRIALDIGVSAVLMLPPFYYKAVQDAGVIAYFCEVIESIADDRLNILLYHFPALAGLPISHASVEELQRRYPTVIKGLKDSSGDFDYSKQMLRAFPDLAIYTGDDHFLQPLMQLGGAGCITAGGNLLAPVLAKIFNSPETMDHELQDQTERVWRDTLLGYPVVEAIKAALSLHSGNADWLRVRPPLQPLPVREASRLLDRLYSAGAIFPSVEQ